MSTREGLVCWDDPGSWCDGIRAEPQVEVIIWCAVDGKPVGASRHNGGPDKQVMCVMGRMG